MFQRKIGNARGMQSAITLSLLPSYCPDFKSGNVIFVVLQRNLRKFWYSVVHLDHTGRIRKSQIIQIPYAFPGLKGFGPRLFPADHPSVRLCTHLYWNCTPFYTLWYLTVTVTVTLRYLTVPPEKISIKNPNVSGRFMCNRILRFFMSYLVSHRKV